MSRANLTIAGIVVVVLLGSVIASALKPSVTALETLTDETVVARLGSYQTPYPAALREAARLARAEPGSAVAAAKAARAYIDYGRQIGDARLAGTALGLLAPWLKSADPHPEILVLAAIALQYNHDFEGAIALLDRALAKAPHYPEALIVRADIEIVQGRLSAARPLCQRLMGEGRVDLGLVCDATASALTARSDAAMRRLEALMAIPRGMDASLLAYATGLVGEIDLFRGRPDEGRSRLEAALAAQPGDLRTIMVLADALLAAGDPAKALAIMADAPPTDGILLRQAIAYRDQGDGASLEPVRGALERTFAVQKELGLTAHAREEARFELEIAGDPAAALERALVNWATQREFEDAQLLIDAAVAAGNPAAAAPVVDWMKAEAVDAPALRLPAGLQGRAP